MQAGKPWLPDGKIYIECSGTTVAMHILNDADSAGTACDLEPHAVIFTKFNYSIPNFPNYDLGRLQASPCDTLLWTSLTTGPSP